jgi:hypothetical protein
MGKFDIQGIQLDILKGKSAGQLLVEIQFFPTGGAMQPPVMPGYT